LRSRACLAVFLTASATSAGAAPLRVVSLNLCADQLVLRLVPKSRIASVTWLAQEETSSSVADLARGIPTNQGFAEEALGVDPDLVVSGMYTTRGAVDFLKRQGRPVLDLGVPESFAETRAQIGEVAGALGVTGEGAALISGMDAKLAAHPPLPAAARPRAMMLGPNGFATSYGPLVDEMMDRAGLVNIAAELGAHGRASIPLETAILGGVDILVVDTDERSGPALALEVPDHPAVRALKRDVEVVALPSKLWTCAGPQLADAVAILADAAARHVAKARP
jgi:iron complex transport system substrate-binding protein